MKVVWYFLMLTVVVARDVTDEEYSRFPRLYHLDDYSGCLAQTSGLYCLGTFHITPLKEPHHTYNILKEYSLDVHHFNRTELHRGYCVSSRCPALSSERNASLRFERCASQWARPLSLRTSLAKLSYCRTHAQEYAYMHNPAPLDAPQKVFLYVVLGLLALNAIGTIYDLVTGDNVKKNPLLLSWSVKNNWSRLTASYENGDPRLAALAPVQGVRVFLMLMIMVTHSGCIHDMLYLYNPRLTEQMFRHPLLMIFLNGTSLVQIFVLLSNFLLAYNLLLFAKTNRITYKILPLITIKRIVRISPVHLLVVGFAATWWARAGSGPQWAPAVAAEAEACSRKFWTHAFYVHNLINPEDQCIIPSWFLAVDMQLYLMAGVLTVELSRRRARALRVLAALVLASSLFNGLLAYIFDWKSLVYFSYPSTVKTMYKGVPSFSWLYQSPWGSLPACFIGLFLAFLHFDMQERGIKMTSFKWLRVPYLLSPFCMLWCTLAGSWLRQYGARAWLAAYVALERPLLSALGGLAFMGIINGMEDWMKQLFSWRGWHALGRMSLSVLMVHWCVNMSLVAARPQTIATSVPTVMADWLATTYFSYLIAVPLTVMVDMPVQRFVMSLIV